MTGSYWKCAPNVAWLHCTYFHLAIAYMPNIVISNQSLQTNMKKVNRYSQAKALYDNQNRVRDINSTHLYAKFKVDLLIIKQAVFESKQQYEMRNQSSSIRVSRDIWYVCFYLSYQYLPTCHSLMRFTESSWLNQNILYVKHVRCIHG